MTMQVRCRRGRCRSVFVRSPKFHLHRANPKLGFQFRVVCPFVFTLSAATIADSGRSSIRATV